MTSTGRCTSCCRKPRRYCERGLANAPAQRSIHSRVRSFLCSGRDHDDKKHPYVEAKQIVAGMRSFTQAIVTYYRSREAKDEL